MALAGNKADLAEKRKVEVEVSSDAAPPSRRLPHFLFFPRPSGRLEPPAPGASRRRRRPRATLRRTGSFSWRPPPRPRRTSTARSRRRRPRRSLRPGSQRPAALSPAPRARVRPRRALLRDRAQAAEDRARARAHRGHCSHGQGAERPAGVVSLFCRAGARLALGVQRDENDGCARSPGPRTRPPQAPAAPKSNCC